MARVTGGQGYNAHDAAQSSSPNFILKSIEFDGFWPILWTSLSNYIPPTYYAKIAKTGHFPMDVIRLT